MCGVAFTARLNYNNINALECFVGVLVRGSIVLNRFPTQSRQTLGVDGLCFPAKFVILAHRICMRLAVFLSVVVSLLASLPARADLRITRDHGGYVEEYKEKYKRVRARGERVIIDGICNSACTLVFGIVPMNKICVTPRASIGFHQAYYDKAFTFGIKVTSAAGTSDLMSYYPQPVKAWINRNGGLTTDMKKITNGRDLWQIVDPCPEEFF